jgi:hypothetical protein
MINTSKRSKNNSTRDMAWSMAILLFAESFLPGFVQASQHKIYYQLGVKSQFNNERKQHVKKETVSKVNYAVMFQDEYPEGNGTVSPMLPGGPDQPEVQNFTPIGTSDMVNPFTGDFSYNIPIMDVDGYPINLAYSAGVTMDQEASWVGLGWNLNPGVVNRAMRGLPDDFNGQDSMKKSFNMKKDWTVGFNGGMGFELFGFGKDTNGTFGLNASIGINYNNYNGFGSEVSISPVISIARENKLSGNFSLGLSGSSQGGPTISPNLSLSKSVTSSDGDGAITTTRKSLNIGTSMNSRGGVGDISMNMSRSSTTQKITGVDRWGHDVSTTIAGSGKSFASSFNAGTSSYTPQISMPMNSFGMTMSFKAGPDAFGFDPSWNVSGYFNSRWLKDKDVSQSAYGYLNLEDGQYDKFAMLDFNRENDGPFTKNTPALPIPMLTYDIFSVAGQGVGGSYRGFRTDLGFVFDPKVHQTSVNGSIGVEMNSGGTVKGGVDITGTYSNSTTSGWTTLNQTKIGFTEQHTDFIEANEMSINTDMNLYSAIGGDQPVRFLNKSEAKLKNTLVDFYGNELNEIDSYTREGRNKRNQVIYTLSHAEVAKGYGIMPLHPDAYTTDTYTNLDHHIAQFTTLNTEGSRYVYGIAAYNYFQKDVSFAVGTGPDNPGRVQDCATGLVGYSYPLDNSVDNEYGIDNYYNSTITPAYAHSYLLTAVLNADYIDVDNVKGPSKGDLGGYIHFSYDKIDNYQWRNPVQYSMASYDEGLNSDNTDDKAHYTWGEKELWYVSKIETKNHVAIFHTSPRKDAHGAIDENGGLHPTKSMMKLDSIKLYSLPEYEANPATAVPIKVAHFEYNYELCPSFPQNIDGDTTGKLTLKEVYFTYQNSQKGRYSAYKFDYGYNPTYDLKSVNRWGGYKPRPMACANIATDPLNPSDFSYLGYDTLQENLNASAWNMNKITLPSGGEIHVDYESDDYAYVQHKRANQMFKIVGVQFSVNGDDDNIETTGVVNVTADQVKNSRIYFELIPGFNSIESYVQGIDKVYFRALMKFGDGRFDFVPGWAEIESAYITQIGGNNVGCIQFKGAKLMDNGNANYNPIAVAAIQFARQNLSRMIPPSSQNNFNGGAPALDMLNALAGAFVSYQEMFVGPNNPLRNATIGTDLVIGKSWLRLNNPDYHRLGGGHRVQKITMVDSWDAMTGNAMPSSTYGQLYTYNLDNGQSSGVASYEPQLGGDENVWRQPISNDTRHLLAPDDRNYQLMPFGEQFFPSAVVGYSQVTIKDLPREGVKRTATGKVVHEFYTAKDFPTFVRRTNPKVQRYKLPVFTYFFTMSIDEMSASQGFVVETNDMHGKPKSQKVYAENQNQPISKVEYFYQSHDLVDASVSVKQLDNTAKFISKSGNVSDGTMGLKYDAFADFRKSVSNTVSATVSGNINITIPYLVIPIVLPSGSYERTAFRSASFTKVIERFGILDRTVATDLGSSVETRTLAYDAETGAGLLTETATDFNDKVYSFTYPAHWYYEGMGQAYLNVDLKKTFENAIPIINGVTNLMSASTGFFAGDEVAYRDGANNVHLGWVTEVTQNAIKILDKAGNPLNTTVYEVKLLRSGKRNLQTTPIGSLTLKSNPLVGLNANVFDNVLQAGAVEFTEDWNTFCECFLNDQSEVYSTNPYVLGLKGTYRPKASYVHLSGRDQSFQNQNSNIRKDGVFTSFLPYYRFVNGKWTVFKENWTYTSSVVEFSPFGQALETIDALNRYSSSVFGYNQSLPIAVAANTQYKQLGFDGFEDYNFENCSDNHFKLVSTNPIVSTESHSGRRSVKVTSEEPLVYETVLMESCSDPGCDLSLAIDGGSEIGNDLSVLIQNGLPPFEIEYTTLQGNPTVSIEDSNNSLKIVGNGNAYSVSVKVTDANGCVIIQTINF